jgi:riboflavin kinase/FMN adenylyltransferase
VAIAGRTVSSSEIRRAVTEGDLRTVNAMLGALYRVRGTVVEGARRGRTIGFPTANLANVETVVPHEGVYAGRAWIDGCSFAAGINLGPNPTFAEQAQKFEAHLLNYQGDLYGRQIDIEFLDRLRDTRPFANVDDLRTQLTRDMEQVRLVSQMEFKGL